MSQSAASQSITSPRGAAAITQAFQHRNKQNGKVLAAYIMAGDPDLAATGEILHALSDAGVDIIELGMPFTDPLADGPVIQKAGQRALRHGFTLKQLLDSVRQWRQTIQTPIVIMTYYNLFFRYGMEAFAEDAAEAGMDGVIAPDLPVEESGEMLAALEKPGLALIPLIAPTSTDERIAAICQKASGFIYYVSRTGVTGMQKDISADLQENVARIRRCTQLPIGVGFGVSNPRQAREISQYADGVVMGSAIVQVIEEAQSNPAEAVRQFTRPIVEALH